MFESNRMSLPRTTQPTRTSLRLLLRISVLSRTLWRLRYRRSLRSSSRHHQRNLLRLPLIKDSSRCHRCQRYPLNQVPFRARRDFDSVSREPLQTIYSELHLCLLYSDECWACIRIGASDTRWRLVNAESSSCIKRASLHSDYSQDLQRLSIRIHLRPCIRV